MDIPRDPVNDQIMNTWSDKFDHIDHDPLGDFRPLENIHGGFVYHESIKREPKRRLIYEYRYNERLKTKTEESTRLADRENINHLFFPPFLFFLPGANNMRGSVRGSDKALRVSNILLGVFIACIIAGGIPVTHSQSSERMLELAEDAAERDAFSKECLTHSQSSERMLELAEDAAERDALSELMNVFPGAHGVELRRFLRKVNGDLSLARENYAFHLQWRKDTSLDTLSRESKEGLARVPRWMWLEYTDQHGERGAEHIVGNETMVLWVQGAMYNSTAANIDDYVRYTIQVLDSALDRASDQKITVMVDTSAYAGMPNEPGLHAVRLATTLASLLNKHYPGRLIKLTIFPVPGWTAYVWEGIKVLLPKRTAAKVNLESIPPAEAMQIRRRLGHQCVSD